MGGYIDWNIIEDRMRQPDIPYYVGDVDEAIFKIQLIHIDLIGCLGKNITLRFGVKKMHCQEFYKE